MVESGKTSKGYCVFVESMCEGLVPSVFDANNQPVVFATRKEANEEIKDYAVTRLAHATNDDEVSIYSADTEEFVLEVRLLENGSIFPVF